MSAASLNTYYRVLYSPAHFSGWNSDPVWNSSHHRPPLQWIQEWNASKRVVELEKQFPLVCFEACKSVHFTARARERFLANPSADYSQMQFQKATYEVGELHGVCAFKTPMACLLWSEGDSQKFHGLELGYVVFDGNYVCEAPEDEGVVVTVERKIDGPMNLGAFKQRHLVGMTQ